MTTGIVKEARGFAGQAGNVFNAGDTVVITPADNVPQRGFYVARHDKPEIAVLLPEDELLGILESMTSHI